MALHIYPNTNPFKMNEYRGFKVGDKVEVNSYNGVVCNVSDSLKKYHVRTERNGVILADEGEMKKLPNFSVGDVVRVDLKGVNTSNHRPQADYQGKLFTIGEIDGNVYLFSDDPHKQKCGFLEQYLMPFDGFRVGDTVWTAKRGKMKIAGNVIPARGERQWVCTDGHDLWCYPKTSNLIPTEAKYKEPMTGGFRIDIALVTPCNPTVDVMFSPKKALNIWKYPPCPEPMPKFKVGDAVFYQGKKWEVMSIKQRTDNPLLRPHIKYDINRQVTPNGSVSACVNESDLRLWKETKFTHIAAFGTDASVRLQKAAHFSPSDYQSCKYLGKNGQLMDVFHCSTKYTEVVILFGEKGDDC